MQYGAGIFPYERLKKSKAKKSNKNNGYANFWNMNIIYFIIAFLISRVVFLNSMAPFGIAFLICIVENEKYKNKLIPCFLGSFIGYVSLKGSLDNLYVYLVISTSIIMLKYILKNLSSKNKVILIYITVYLELLLYKLIINKITMGSAVMMSIFEIGCIFPIYFIINYSINCVSNFNTTYLYSNEDIISIAITVSLVISGAYGFQIFHIGLRNIVALTFLIIIGYIKGGTCSASIGIVMGAVVGIGSNQMITYIAIYGLCGLIAGVFKETGKWITGAAFLVCFSILKMYSNINYEFKIIECLIAVVMFYAISNKYYDNLRVQFDCDRKMQKIQEGYIDKIKSIINDKLNNFSKVLLDTSRVLKELAENEQLAMKNKSNGLIENLADRVCNNCNMRNICWKREGYYTYNALGELIQNYEENIKKVPNEIERKCVNRNLLLNHTEDIVNNFVMSEMWRKRLSECREILSSQFYNMGSSVNDISKEFDENIKLSKILESQIRVNLSKNNIKYKDVFCYNDENGRLKINLFMESCGGQQFCTKNILPLMNKITGKLMCISEEGCNINIDTHECNVAFEESAKFHITTHSQNLCKDGEKSPGDNYYFGKTKSGNFITVLSDGMGSGAQAGKESDAVVELVKSFSQSGFDKITAINTINSIMGIKFSESEKFSTIDLCDIDLYNGNIEFMKVGAVASFIKSENDVKVIQSKTLPIGVLDKADVDIENCNIKNGDLIVMLSDGALDYENSAAGKIEWVVEYLNKSMANNPKELCEGLIEETKKLSKGKIKDDITIIVQKVYSLY